MEPSSSVIPTNRSVVRSLSVCLPLSLSLSTADKAYGRKKFSRERVCFLEVKIEGVPGGAPPWDCHQSIEEGLFYKRVCRPEKVYEFTPYQWSSKLAKFLDMVGERVTENP